MLPLITQSSNLVWNGRAKFQQGFKTTIKDLKDPNNGAWCVSPVTRGSPPRVSKRSVVRSGASFAKGGTRHWSNWSIIEHGTTGSVRPRMGTPLRNSDWSSPQTIQAYMADVFLVRRVSGPLARFHSVTHDFVTSWASNLVTWVSD